MYVVLLTQQYIPFHKCHQFLVCGNGIQLFFTTTSATFVIEICQSLQADGQTDRQTDRQMADREINSHSTCKINYYACLIE